VILVARIIDRRDLALAECVVERVVDLSDIDAKPRRRVAIDGDVGLEPLILLVGVDLGDLRDRLQFRENARRPREQLIGIVILERVLILGVAGASAETDILDRLQEERRSRDLGDIAAQPGDDAVR
jgi:hypothetical protein